MTALVSRTVHATDVMGTICSAVEGLLSYLRSVLQRSRCRVLGTVHEDYTVVTTSAGSCATQDLFVMA